MGTSSSSRGSGSSSSMVPEWADPDPNAPLPQAEPGRFRAFRSSLGSYVKYGDPADLRRAIGHFARTGTGGGRIAVRRLGSITLVGSRLVSLLTEMRSGGTGETSTQINFNELRGKNTDYAIQEIARLLTPSNGDASKINRSLQLALSTVVEGMENFEPSALTDDILIDMMVVYMRESIFELIVMESGKAFQKNDNLDAVLAAEVGLRDLISVCVDEAIRPLVGEDIGSMSAQTLIEAQQQAIANIWAEWENN